MDKALLIGKPQIFNTDQGAQFTSHCFTDRLLEAQINISMDGKGRALDNIFIERLWRDVKHQHIYLYDYENGKDLYEGLKWYFNLHNEHKPHQSLDYKTPAQVYKKEKKASKECAILKPAL